MQLDFITIVALAPIVIALVQVAKAIPGLARQGAWLPPLLSLVVAAVVTAAWYVYQPPPGQIGLAWWGQWAIHAIVLGLSAAGLYSVAGKKALGIVDQFLSALAKK